MNEDVFKLPTSIVGKSDINRILRELDGLDDFFMSAAARKSGESIKAPRTTYMLDQLARDNGYNLMQTDQRTAIKTKLIEISRTAPSLHISFAVEPTPRIIDVILSWMRGNIHPQLMLQIGLQPTIAAGCVLRSPNKIFDLSLRTYLENQENYMVELIQGAVGGKR
ncbi:MAG TPA: hypothetical protein VFB03_03560 [Candidatus Saccharimonadales bacterium]|nr:hypothetical protein [Candidatus Saccharimonadales bacterium]